MIGLLGVTIFAVLVAPFAVGLWKLGFFTFLFSESFVWRIYHQRFWITAIILFLVSTRLLKHFRNRDAPSENTEEGYYLSPEQMVLSLEEYRVEHGYQPAWLEYRCSELGLLDELTRLREEGIVPSAPSEEEEHRSSRSDRAQTKPQPPNEQHRDPYEVLGIKPGASHAEAKRAYYATLKLYHPDRVHGLGSKLQAVAQDVTVQVNAAFSTLCDRNGWR